MHEDTHYESSLPTIVYQLDGWFVVGFTLESGSSNSINEPQIVFFPASGNENLSNSGTLILNVGGTINQVKWETIDKFPKSRLQKLRYATCDGL